MSLRDSEEECNELTSLSIDAPDTSTGVTTFVQEACTTVEVAGSTYVPSTLVHPSEDIQDLKRYFERPRLIHSAAIPTGTRASSFQWNASGATIFTSWFPNGFNRLMGVYGVRFSVVFSLQVAATPFHQGVLALGWQYAIASNSSNRYFRGNRAETITNLPHARLDLSADTMVTLKIPFMFHTEFMSLPESEQINAEYGSLALAEILHVVAVAGISAPTFKLYVHLEDMELFGAAPMTYSTIALQAGKKVHGKSPMEEEADSTKRPISTTLSNVSHIVKKFQGVPLLSSYATTAKWLLDATAGTAKAFGYSKPTIEEVPVKMTNYTTVCEHNVDAPSQAVVLSAYGSNRLKIDPVFSGTDVDEMSLKYVTSQYSQICIGSISTANTHGAAIYGTNVGPASMWFRTPLTAPYGNLPLPDTAGAAANSFMPSSVMFWSSMFRCWRGGFKYRFTFAKTKHHAGRVMVSYSPSFTATTNATVYATCPGPEISSSLLQPFGYSKVFDLKDSNVFEFEVPYTSPYPFTYWYDAIGGLVMSIMDPLQAPSVVASTIYFMVEVCAADDYELALPSGVRFPALPQGTIVTQSSKKLAGVESAQVSELTVGEKTNSVKQLIAIPTWNLGVMPATSYLTVSLFPWYYHRDPTTAIPAPAAAARYCAFSYGGNAATCYVYARGGTDYHAYAQNNSNTTFEFCLNSSDFGKGELSTSYEIGSGSSQVRTMFSQNYAHCRVPANQLVTRVPSNVYNLKSWNMNLGDGARSTSMFPSATGIRYHVAQALLACRNSNASGITVSLSRAAADDAMLGQYIGPPPCALPNSIPTAAFDSDWPPGPQ